MGDPALRTQYTLDGKKDQGRLKLHGTFVMSIANETAFPAAGTFNPMGLKSVDLTIINILGKIIAVFKDNCYHIQVSAVRSFAPGTVWRKTGRLVGVWPVFFHWNKTIIA